MIKTASCPSKEELIRLNHGDLPGDHLESVCDHVEACKKCQLILGQLDDPPDEFAKQLAQITPDALENARVAIEAETLKETATSIWGQFSPVIESKDRKPTLTVPCNLRQYEVLRLIGHGGMGEVYEGRHTNLKRPVALKVIHGIRQDDPVAYEHFLREMETAGQLEHPNLVRAYDAWEHDGCLFLAQELLDGESLQQLASKGLIKTPAEIIDALLGTCRALEQLHAKGFVHRDVKPGNIMRQTDGTIKLIDYGLAIASGSAKSAARVGAGTVGYMSPEQAHGTGPIDHRSDIYSTGRVLKYLLIKLPTDTKEPKQSKVVEKLNALANRLTQKDPKDRLQNVYAVIVQLEQLQQPLEPVEATATTSASPRVGQRRRKKRTAPSSAIEPEAPPKRRGVIWLVLAALLIGIIGFGAFQIIFKTDSRATVMVENHQPGDVIQITSEDGKVRSVELGDQPKFVVDRGTYALSLVGADSRGLNPANITVTGRDQLTVRVEDRPAETATTAQANPGQSTRKPFELKMVNIPAGRFIMGASENDTDARANESLQRTIEFTSPFRMSTHEITVGQFREFVEATGYRTEAETSGEGGWIASRASSWGEQNPDFNWSNPGYTVADSHPVSMVSYADAVVFCDWLSQRDDRVYRLPTEAEWEYACRAGTTTAYHFPKISRDAYCWSLFSVKDTVRPRPVGTRQPNAWGLHDMSGNVREWCMDWYSENAYQREYDQSPTGPVDGTLRVVRGGCFMDLNAFLRSSHRGFVKPQQALNTQGFRVVEGELQVATPMTQATPKRNQNPSLHMLAELVSESTASITVSQDGLTVFWDRNGVVWSAERDNLSEGSTFRNGQEWIGGRHLTISGDVGVLLIKQPNRDSETLHEFTLKNGKPTRPKEISTLVPDSGRVYSPHLSSDGNMLCFAGRVNGQLPQLFYSKRSTSGHWTIALPLLRDSQLTDGWTWPSLLDDGKVLLTANQGPVVRDDESRHPHNIFIARRTSVNEPFTRTELIDLPGLKSLWFQSPCYMPETGELFVLVQPRSEAGTPTWKPAVIRGVRLDER